MEKRTKLWVIFVLAIVAVAVWLIYPRGDQKKPQQKPVLSSQTQNSELHDRIDSAAATRHNPNTNSTSSNPLPADIEARYRQGLISKDEAMSEFNKTRFNQPQSFYAKVIDQDGQPIAGAEASAVMQVLSGVGGELQNRTYKTQSDPGGLFEFTGAIGGPLNVNVKKDGYLLGERGEGYQGPPGDRTTPYERAIITMWKLRGPEPLVNYNIDSKIPFDGTSVTFDIATQKIDPEGELRVALSRTPLNVRRSGQAFDWTIKVEMARGGLLMENDPYPYWAPESGYAPVFQTTTSSNTASWFSHLAQGFYIRSADGKYGRMQVDVYTALTPARAQFNLWMNPSGSQNLEPSPPQ